MMKSSPLNTARVLLEACPPALGERDKAFSVLKKSFSCYNSFHAVSVPDLQDDSEFRRKRDRVPNDEFARFLRDLTAKPLSLYKVVVSCDRPEFETWLGRAEELGCGDVFLVGGDTTRGEHKKGALGMTEAARIARDRGFRCGGIIIPTRRKNFVARPASIDEGDRVIEKIREKGLLFFTTQILYESEWMSCLLLDLVRRLPPEEIPKIFLTFSPFVCPEDIAFARKSLGVYVPRDVERQLRGAQRGMREASIACLTGVWDRLSTFAAEIGFPTEKLAVNVEYLDSRNPRNVESAFELAEEFGRFLRKRTA